VTGKGCTIVGYGRWRIAHMVSEISALEDTGAGTAVACRNDETNSTCEASIEHP
jgi:hypothetical protein